MSVKHVIDLFSKFEKLPIQIKDIPDQLTDMGVSDNMLFLPFNEDPGWLLGMLVRWRQSQMYGSPSVNAAICYNTRVSPAWQRLICCKEMLHLFDPPGLVVSTRSGLSSLLDRLLGKIDVTVLDVVDTQALFEKAAVYQALAVLFPHEIREDFVRAVGAKQLTPEQVANIVDIPPEYIPFLLSEEWEGLREAIMF